MAHKIYLDDITSHEWDPCNLDEHGNEMVTREDPSVTNFLYNDNSQSTVTGGGCRHQQIIERERERVL